MKKFFKVLFVAMAVAIAVPSVKAERLEMPVDKMPAQVATFLNDYYPGVAVQKSWAKMMRPTTEPMWYRVNLANGVKLQFTLDGNWNEINAKKSDTAISIDFLPQAARKYISKNDANDQIKAIKFKKDKYRVTLSNGVKLTFEKNYGFVDQK